MMQNLRLTNTIEDMIGSSVSSLKSDVVATISTLDEQMQHITEKLETAQTELKAADNEIKQQYYATTDQLETLVAYQLTTLDSTIVGLRACSQYATNIRDYLARKVKQLTTLTVMLGLLSIAAIIIAIVR